MADNRHTGMIEIRKGKLSDSENIVELQLRMAQETKGLQFDRNVVSKGVRGVFEEPTRGLLDCGGKRQGHGSVFGNTGMERLAERNGAVDTFTLCHSRGARTRGVQKTVLEFGKAGGAVAGAGRDTSLCGQAKQVGTKSV